MKRIYLLAPLAVLAVAGCNKGSDTATSDNSAVVDNVAVDENVTVDNSANAMAAAPMPSTPQEFANMAASSDNYEIESSKLAKDKAQSADVKSFAAMLVTDHTKSTAALKAAAAKASPAVTPDPTLTPEQQSNLDALKAAAPADFDQLYLSQQIPAHEKALGMLQGYAAGGDVAPFKDFSSNTAPVVQQHLDKARSLQSSTQK